jgi:hypothetical protein
LADAVADRMGGPAGQLRTRVVASMYVVAGRLVNWVTIGLGAAALYGYLGRKRARGRYRTGMRMDATAGSTPRTAATAKPNIR